MTKLWSIDEHPGYTVEQTRGAWALWGPCDSHEGENCPRCDGEGEIIVAVCGQGADGEPMDKDMVAKVLGSKAWTPRRIEAI